MPGLNSLSSCSPRDFAATLRRSIYHILKLAYKMSTGCRNKFRFMSVVLAACRRLTELVLSLGHVFCDCYVVAKEKNNAH